MLLVCGGTKGNLSFKILHEKSDERAKKHNVIFTTAFRKVQLCYRDYEILILC